MKHVGIVDAIRRWLNRILIRAHSPLHEEGGRYCAAYRMRQGGAILLEVVATVGAAGVVAGSAMHFHAEVQRQALDSQVAASASAFASALNLQQAAAALGRNNPLFDAQGAPAGIFDSGALTTRGCEALWHALVIAIDGSMSSSLPAGQSSNASESAKKGWDIHSDGDRCIFAYIVPGVGSKSFSYTAATGRISL